MRNHLRILWLLPVLALILASNRFVVPLSYAETIQTSPWLLGNPTLKRLDDLPVGTLSPVSLNPNRDCQPQKVITRPERLKVQSEQSRSGCVVETGYGTYDRSGLLQRQGTEVSGPVYNRYGGTASIIPIPRSGSVLLVSGYASYGSYVELIKDFDSYLDTTTLPDGSVYHQMEANTPFSPLTDKSGQSLPLVYDTISFSANGDWMIADVPYIGFVRVEIDTRVVTPFSDPTDYRVAVNPSYRTAISPDGRYAVIVSAEFVQNKLFDLSTCGVVPLKITGKVTCQSKSLHQFMNSSITDYLGTSVVRFRGIYGLEIYANYLSSNQVRVAHGYVIAQGKEIGGFDYLGLGDSFASGEGAYQYKALTDTVDNMCHVSLRSYPYLISKQLSYGQSESVACSGSVIDDVLNDTQTYYDKKSRAKNKSDPSYNNEIFSNFLPGYRAQKIFVSNNMPNVVTISAVGNDIGFAKIISRCVSADTCYSSYEDRLEKIREIDRQFSRLVDMYTLLRSSGGPNARVYAIGYPLVANPGGDCAVNVHLNKAELQFANDLTAYLNDMISRATQRAGIGYVDVSEAFQDHKLCDRTKAIAVNGLTAGKDMKIFGDSTSLDFAKMPIGNESYHPNAYGHELLAQTILQQTNNFTSTMPDPQPNITQPVVTSGVAVLDNASKSNRVVRQLRTFDDMGNDTTMRGSTWQGSTGTFRLQPNSKITVEIHSTPITLGQFITTPAGAADFTVTIPSSIDAGFHTLHIMGKNVAGEDIDLEKTVFVGAEETDFDGDGIANIIDPCPTAPQSNEDTDKDGIDDGCDGLISEPAVPSPPEPPIVIPYDPQPTDPPLDGPLQAGKELPPHESDPWASYISEPQPQTGVTVSQTTNDTVAVIQAPSAPQVLAAQTFTGPEEAKEIMEGNKAKPTTQAPSLGIATAKQSPLGIIVAIGLILLVIGASAWVRRR